MKILVTGATGFVGRHLVAALGQRGHQVVALARDASRAKDLGGASRVRFIAGDLGRADQALLDACAGCDAAAHLAWPGLPDYLSPSHNESTLPAHYQFLADLVEAGLPHLLVTGTCLEYGLQEGCLSEGVATQPTLPYAVAKDSLRRMLESLGQRIPFRLQWARLFYTHGPGQHPNSLLAAVDRAVAVGRAEFDMSGGEQLRDYLPVEEMAGRLALLLERPSCTGIINVCSGRPISVRRLVEQHLEKRGARLQLNLGRRPYTEYEPFAFWGDATKLDQCLGQEARAC